MKYKSKELTFRELTDIFSKQHLQTLAESTRKEYQRHIDSELLGKHKWGDIPVSEFGIATKAFEFYIKCLNLNWKEVKGTAESQNFLIVA